jgi:hypothetical protein
MAKIYSSPITEPTLDWQNPNDWQTKEEGFKADLKAKLLERNPKGKNVGEVIKFQVADGYAEYMVASMKPMELIYLNLLDGYQSEFAHLMTAKAVQDKLNQQIALDKIFSKM